MAKLSDMLNNAKESSWITDEYTPSKLNSVKRLGDIAFKIELKRNSMGLGQKEFAEFMGVSQAMVSKWESGSYNFSVNTLGEICDKLELDLTVNLAEKEVYVTDNYNIVNYSNFKKVKKSKIGAVEDMEGIV